MVDYKALRGDPSDNIPGVKGIGEKGASELIKDFKSLDELYKAIHAGKTGDKIRPRVLELLKAQEKEARMSYELSVIVCDVPLDIKVDAYNLDALHLQQTVKLFQELEFRSLVNKLPKTEQAPTTPSASGHPSLAGGEAPRSSPPFQGGVPPLGGEVVGVIGKQDYEFVDTEEKLQKALKELSAAKELSIDTETTSLNTIDAKLVGIGLCAIPGKAYYVPAALALSSTELKKFIESDQTKKIGHNIKYDLEILQRYQLSAISYQF